MAKDFELNLVSGNVKAAMREADAGKSDMYWAPRAGIRLIPGFNVRTPGPEYDAHIAHIGSLILKNGFDRTCPLKAYISKEGDANIVNVYDGHTRVLASDWATERGAVIERFPIITAPAGTTMEDITMALITTNEGKQLTPFEKGVVCKRLLSMGVSEDDLSERLGYSRSYVSDLLFLQGAPKKIRDMVTASGVSAANAVTAMKKHGAQASEVLATGLEIAKAAGKTKVTKKDLTVKRDLLEDGANWISLNSEDGECCNAMMVGLLAHMAGRSEDAAKAAVIKARGR